MSFIAYLAPNGSCGWLSHVGNRATGVASNGDLVLSIRDVRRMEELVDGGLLERWANEWQFSLEGIDQDVALRILMFDYVLATCFELEDDSTIIATLRGIGATASDDTIPDLTVRLSGAAVAAALICVFDGPSDTDEAFHLAASQRIAFIGGDAT